MISGAFAIIAQSQVLGCFPRVRVTHTSKKYHGQVYIPEDNFCYKIEISHASIIPLHNCFMQLLLNSLHLKFQYKHRCTEVAHNIMCSLIYLPRLSASSPLLANMLYCHCCLSYAFQSTWANPQAYRDRSLLPLATSPPLHSSAGQEPSTRQRRREGGSGHREMAPWRRGATSQS
uniref:K+ potassium transporter integral membrane domain-containing protein n=1 Tax=Aegilops tauschii subsp. strangulata TaxID=200361 RepID=A0A453GF67_AEGTS